MDLFTLIKVILGRWKLVVPILVATVLVAFMVHTTTPSEYEANGFLLLGTPELDVAEEGDSTVSLVQVAQDLKDEGKVDAEFTVTALGGDYFSVTVFSDESQDAVVDAQAFLGQLEAEIAAVQEAEDVLPAERAELRMVTANVLAEPQPDGSFAASSSVFLWDPTVASANPYLPNAATGRLLQVAVTGDAGREAFAELAGPGVSFVMDQAARDAAPLLQVVTTGSDADQVIEAFHHVETLVARELEQRQERAGVLESQRLRIEAIDVPLGVVDESPPVARATAGVLGLGGLLALGLAIGLEGLDRRRKGQMALRMIDSAPQPSTATQAVPTDLDDSAGSRPTPDEVPTPTPAHAGPPEAPAHPSQPTPMPAPAGPMLVAGVDLGPAAQARPASALPPTAAQGDVGTTEPAAPEHGIVSHSLEERLRLARAERIAAGWDQEDAQGDAEAHPQDEPDPAQHASSANGGRRPRNGDDHWTRRLELADQGDRPA